MNLLLDKDFLVCEVSSGLLALLACSKEDVQGCLFSRILDENVPLAVIYEYEQAVIKGEPHTTVLPLKITDTVAWLSLKFSPSILNGQSMGGAIDFHLLDEFSIMAVKTLFLAIEAEEFSAFRATSYFSSAPVLLN